VYYWQLSVKFQDKIKQSLESKAALEDDAKDFEKDIKQWEADFLAQNKRKPEEIDRYIVIVSAWILFFEQTVKQYIFVQL